MTPAEWDSTVVQITAGTSAGDAVFRANGRSLVFDGFLRLNETTENGDIILPKLSVGADLAPLQIDPQQQYSNPPPRYTEASLVKKLESEGDRPSEHLRRDHSDRAGPRVRRVD